MAVLILGSEGVLGSYLAKYLKSNNFEVISLNRLNYSEKIEELNKNYLSKIETIINCVALTDVDECEKNVKKSFQSNSLFIKKFFEEINIKSYHLINFSSDQVYSGNGPHKEKNPLPINVYGITKLLGEEYASNFPSTILRINYLAKSPKIIKKSFSDWLFYSLKNSKSITLFEDIFFNPLYVDDLCRFIKIVILNPIHGIYNLGSKDYISKADFGIRFAKELGLSTKYVKIGKSLDSKLTAKRPFDMRMDVSLFEQTFSQNLPCLFDAIKKLTNDYL